jgi:hypothetical protein
MPFYFDVTDVIPEVVNFKSVMIVPCRFCPAASMAVRSNEPYIEFPRRSPKTASYERLIKTMRQAFENRGIKTSVLQEQFTSPVCSLYVDFQAAQKAVGTCKET